MRIKRRQLKLLIENYLLEQESVMADVEEEEDAESLDTVEDEAGNTEEEPASDEEAEAEEPETPEVIEFKVSTDDGDKNISLRRKGDETIHKIYVDDKRTLNIDAEMDLQILAAHGYIHQSSDEETKKILQKILSRDSDFKGKNESGILAVISDKMSARLGVQGYSKDNLVSIIEKG